MGGATFTLHLGKASEGHRAANRVPVSELGNREIRGGGELIQQAHSTGILLLDASSSGQMLCRWKWHKRILIHFCSEISSSKLER